MIKQMLLLAFLLLSCQQQESISNASSQEEKKETLLKHQDKPKERAKEKTAIANHQKVKSYRLMVERMEKRQQPIPKEEFPLPPFWLTEDVDWEAWSVNLPPKEKMGLLSQLVGNDFFIDDEPIPSYRFHVIDFNGDGLLDVIFEGQVGGGGAEMNNVTFFQNDGIKLKITLKLLGMLVGISRTDSRSPIAFKLWEYPCCANKLHVIQDYRFYNGSDKRYCKNEKASTDYYTVSYGKYARNGAPNFEVVSEMKFVKTTEMPQDTLQTLMAFITVKKDALFLTRPNRSSAFHFEFEWIPKDLTRPLIVAKMPLGLEGKVIASKQMGDGLYYFVQADFKKPIMSAPLGIGGARIDGLSGWVHSEDIVCR